MKTAIKIIAQKLLDIKTLNLNQVTEIVNILSTEMETEKQQIIDAFNKGMDSVEYFLPNNEISEAEQYFKETYIDSNEADA